MTAAVVAGCTDEELQSELDTKGPPRVTLVTVETGGGEVPAYCPGEDADKISVVCFDAAGNYSFDAAAPAFAAPIGGSVRLAFNELLDPDRAEELVIVRDETGQPARDPYGNPVLRGTLVSSQPVILTCNEQPVAYDGFYNPSGNHLSLPPGPSLVIRPLGPVATGARCTVEVVEGESNPGFGVFDKAGNPVSAEDRGPFEFQIAPLAITDASPSGATGVTVEVTPLVTFNTPIDPASLGAEGAQRVRLRTAVDDVDVAAALSVDGSAVTITPASPLAPETEYEVVVYAGIADTTGGTLALDADPTVVATFTTGTAPPAPGT
jgi:hypothetical protein